MIGIVVFLVYGICIFGALSIHNVNNIQACDSNLKCKIE